MNRYVHKKFGHDNEVIAKITNIGNMMQEASRQDSNASSSEKSLKKIRSLVTAHQAEV
jgi:hypothetical protein